MGIVRRRFFVPGLLVLLLALVAGSGARWHSEQRAHAAPAEDFTQADPARLYVGDSSHGVAVLARANPALGLRGYCVEVQNSGITATGTGDGFTVTAGSTVTDTDFYDANTPSDTTDDVYCATIQAAASGTTLTLSWNYTDGSTTGVAELEIELVTVTLQGFNGVVGGAASVCTVDWDPTFLTGEDSNTPPGAPNPLDKGHVDDWDETAGTEVGVYKNTSTGEWCLNLTSGAPAADIDVEFTFYAVYDLTTTADDQLHTIGSTTNDIVDINDVDFSELRHISLGGQIMPEQDSNENVIRARHYACVIPSAVGDVLNANDIHFSGNANVSGLEIFNEGIGAGPSFAGVLDGTICIGWTSTQPGEHFLTLSFTKNVGTLGLGVRQVRWDTNDDNNDQDATTSGPNNRALLTQWNEITHTEITDGGDPREGTVPITDTTVTHAIEFNIASGKFISGGLDIVEWVFGEHTGPTGLLTEMALEGVELTIRIEGSCGYFVSEDGLINLGQTITGVSYGGRFDRGPSAADPTEILGDGPDDIAISIDDDGGCTVHSVLRLEIDASYPGDDDVFDTEFVEVTFEFTVGAMTPSIAWAGQTVAIAYEISSDDCDALNGTEIHFVRAGGQSGSFLPDAGVQLNGSDHAVSGLGDCATIVRYESEEPGEVDISVFIEGNQYSKVVFTIYYLALEDVTTTASPSLVVSEIGDLSASVRGWFVGNNPSGRPAEMKPDGRGVPADRWILPTDWETLRGDADSRQNWPSSPTMPLTYVTFVMEHEEIANDYKKGIKTGDSGWFVLDGTEFDLNINPMTHLPSVLGSFDRPRIISDLTDEDGVGTVDTFGDLNLTYEACPANPHTGNPYCRVGDVVGHTRYYAVADYPQTKGHFPPARSNVAQTDWTWAGYKQLTVVDTDAPTVKYVVAHLKDRDGFCDAKSYHNLLGIPLLWEIDAGEGAIIGQEGMPSSVNQGRRTANTTTFDIVDDLANPLNEDISRTPVAADECQSWIKVSNSLLTATNVRVTFPAPPSPPPGEIRITGLTCTGGEKVTITNLGPNLVSLAGFSLRSLPPDPLDPEEYLGIYGLLEPGESRSFSAGPNAPVMDWQYVDDEVFTGPSDWARLVWNGFEMSRMYCDGRVHTPDIPETLPLDGEGEIVVDITVNFGAQANRAMEPGWNLVTAGREGSITAALAGNDAKVAAIYTWDPIASRWKLYTPSGPAFLNSFDRFEAGRAYWVQVKQPFTLYVPE